MNAMLMRTTFVIYRCRHLVPKANKEKYDRPAPERVGLVLVGEYSLALWHDIQVRQEELLHTNVVNHKSSAIAWTTRCGGTSRWMCVGGRGVSVGGEWSSYTRDNRCSLKVKSAGWRRQSM